MFNEWIDKNKISVDLIMIRCFGFEIIAKCTDFSGLWKNWPHIYDHSLIMTLNVLNGLVAILSLLSDCD